MRNVSRPGFRGHGPRPLAAIRMHTVLSADLEVGVPLPLWAFYSIGDFRDAPQAFKGTT